MDTKWKEFSYSASSKVIAFVLVVTFYSAFLTMFINDIVFHNINLNWTAEKSYYQSGDFNSASNDIIQNITAVIGKYKSEEFILSGGSAAAEELDRREDSLYLEFKETSHSYDPHLSETGNYKVFLEVYADRLRQANEQLIRDDLRRYQEILQGLNAYTGLIYYAQRGDTVLTNSSDHGKDYFKSNPAYLIFEGFRTEMFPEDIYFFSTGQIGPEDIVYVAFTDEFLAPRLAAWKENQSSAANRIYGLAGLALALAAAFICLLFITGRKPEDGRVHLNSSTDKIYNDINLGLCLLLIALWAGGMSLLFRPGVRSVELTFLITLAISAAGLVLVLSLVRHVKNRTFFTHSLTYYVFSGVFAFVKDVVNSGGTAVKVVLIVVFYPIIASLSLFLLPVVIVAAAWMALQKVKEYDRVKTGVKTVRDGDLSYKIDIPGDGEFARLAADINSITDGLGKAVENEIRSERLKSELISNVSHDIRTPLTSIITYVDLLKKERDPQSIAEYVEVLEQKAQRLKILTDDLFEAAKASSGNIPVNLERIDLSSLLTQGLGEIDDQIIEQNLEFKFNHSEDKVFVRADGKLLWRAIENLLLNVLKYAQPGSRVYIDIMDEGPDVLLTIKNISAHELNISAGELMERFTRGDAARTSQGSGLGLSIAQSLVELQKGSFSVEIDGDLFKAAIHLPKESG